MSKSFGPLLEVARIQSEINKLFNNLLDLGNSDESAGTWTPNVDILETEDNVIVRVELPGVPHDALKVSVLGGNLILTGSKAEPVVRREGRIQVSEISFGPFRRSVHLEVPVNTRKADAVFTDGLLRISFPKVPNRRGEEVPIEVTSA